MVFNSMQFILFFPIVVGVLLIVPKAFRIGWLLVTSYYFYMCWNPEYALLLGFSTLTTYLAGLALEKKTEEKHKKVIVAVCCLANLGILFVFKYFNFSIDSINWILNSMEKQPIQSHIDLLLPVGISFYTFQAIGYIVDAYRSGKAEHNLLKYALFVSFFPQLGSGPIERSKNIFPQLEALKTRNLWEYERIKNGFLLLLWGMFQKIVIADRLALYVDTVYGTYQNYGLLVIGTAIVLYSFQIYCDFDSYSNMARGVAQIMGVDIMQNFKRPYFATNIQEFWRRWHISLTSWFRDYLYIPLGGNRKGELRKQLNVLIVFLVSGLWHGASWNYVIWGGMHGIMQVVHNIYFKICKEKKESFSVKLRNGICTFGFVTVAWLFFRVNSIEQLLALINQMTSQLGDFTSVLTVLGDGDRNLLILGLIILFIVDFIHEKGISIRNWIEKQEFWFRYTLYIGVIAACIYLGIHTAGFEGATQFIYFQF